MTTRASRTLTRRPSLARAHGAKGRQRVHRAGVAEEGVDESGGFPSASGHEKVAEEEVEAERSAAAEEPRRDACRNLVHTVRRDEQWRKVLLTKASE